MMNQVVKVGDILGRSRGKAPVPKIKKWGANAPQFLGPGVNFEF
jgi:ribosomal protein L1